MCAQPAVTSIRGDAATGRALVAAHNLNNPEGVPRYLSEIVVGLRDRNAIDPVVLSPLGGAGSKVYDDAGIPVDVRETAVSRRFVDGLWSPRRVRVRRSSCDRVIGDHRPEVVIANTLTTFPLVEAAARAGVPAVWIIHESYSREHLDIVPAVSRKRVGGVRPGGPSRSGVARHGRLVCSPQYSRECPGDSQRARSKPFDDYLRRVTREAAAVRLPGPPASTRFVAVGTVCERKGQHTLVEAAAALARQRRDFACYLVGARRGIPYSDYVRHLITRHRLESIVHLVPETDDVWSFYRAADAFVCTSHMETFSRAILEAEAFGLPIVSTPVCGVGEQVVWNANALPFGFGDALALAEQFRRLLDNPGLRQEMGRESRAMFDVHLNHTEMLDRYAAVILAAARHGPRASAPLAGAEVVRATPRRAA